MSTEQPTPISNSQADDGSSVTSEPRGPPKACIFIARLSPATTEEDLQNLFSEFGSILKIKLLRDSKSSRAYAFVQYSQPEHADAAITKANGRLLDGRNIKVERAKVQRTLFIAKFSRSMEEDELRELVKSFGPIENITIIKNRQSQKSKGCGFIRFAYREDALEAFEALKLSQRRWIIEWANSTDAETTPSDAHSIFVGGLPLDVTKEAIEARFSPHGTIDTITIVTKEPKQDGADALASPHTPDSPDETDSSASTNLPIPPKSSFAFIRYVDTPAAAQAIQTENGSLWGEKSLRVQYVHSHDSKNRRRNNTSRQAFAFSNMQRLQFPPSQKFDRNRDFPVISGFPSDRVHHYDPRSYDAGFHQSSRGQMRSRGRTPVTGPPSAQLAQNHTRVSRGSNSHGSRGMPSSGRFTVGAPPPHYSYRGSPVFLLASGAPIYSQPSSSKYSYPPVAPPAKTDLPVDPSVPNPSSHPSPPVGQPPSFFPPQSFGQYHNVSFGYDRQHQWQFYPNPTTHYPQRQRHPSDSREDHIPPESQIEMGISAPPFDRSIPFPDRF